MKTEIKSSLSTEKTLSILSILCLVFGILGAVLGEIALPFLIGALAALYLFIRDDKRVYAIILSVGLVIINVVGFYLDLTSNVFSLNAIILALIISLSYKKGSDKADSAYVMTIISAAFTVVGFALFAMQLQGEYSLDAVVSFYTEVAAELKTIFVEKMSMLYAAADVEIGEEVVAAVFDYQISMLPSYLLIGGFAISGLSFKVFSFIVGKYSADTESIRKWRFIPTRLFAYFYAALMLAAVFLTSTGDLLAISVLNLYNIFLVVFAYVGFNFVIALLSRRTKPATALLVMAVLTVVFASFALQLLAVVGVMFITRKNIPDGANKV